VERAWSASTRRRRRLLDRSRTAMAAQQSASSRSDSTLFALVINNESCCKYNDLGQFQTTHCLESFQSFDAEIRTIVQQAL
jgi:hypothetical protein